MQVTLLSDNSITISGVRKAMRASLFISVQYILYHVTNSFIFVVSFIFMYFTFISIYKISEYRSGTVNSNTVN